MTVLFVDTETTGFVQDRYLLDHSDQPFMVQLACELCEDDGGEPLSNFAFIINNTGTNIPDGAAAIHGITTEKAVRAGISNTTAIDAFQAFYRGANLVVAHNMKFDKAIIEIAIWRALGTLYPLRKPLFCTMETSAPIINLPPSERMIAAGIDKPKAPKLSEAMKHFFNEDLDGAHDARVDVAACRRVYFHLKSIGAA